VTKREWRKKFGVADASDGIVAARAGLLTEEGILPFAGQPDVGVVGAERHCPLPGDRAYSAAA
jgi:hypothetical protein